jgi:DNA-binding CsgD family transcriptional regulator
MHLSHQGCRDQTGGHLALHVEALHALGWAHDLNGDTPQAVACYEEVLEITESHGESVFRSYALWALGIAVWQQGDRIRSVGLIEQGLQLARRVKDPLTGVMCLESLAWIASEEGRARRAVVLMEAANELGRAAGQSAVLFPDLNDYHEDCERRVRRTLSPTAFEEACKEGRSMSFDGALSYALGEQTPGARGTGTSATLTKRERQIADLVAQGLTNKAIAAKLVISQRTVHGHVEHILAKLGFTSRTQIAAWAVEQTPRGSARSAQDVPPR